MREKKRQKYADYDDLKERQVKYDEYQAQNKNGTSEEKKKSDALQAKIARLKRKTL